MFFAFKGEVFKIEPTKLFLDVSGIIYEIAIPLMSYDKLQNQKQVFVYVTLIVREDAHLLFGFSDALQKDLFDRLIKINGVGPKVALSILSTYSAQDFMQIIQNKDVGALQRVSGIGAKSAGKIMVDIAGFYVDLLPDAKSLHHEAKLALQSLGFKNNAIDKVLKEIQASNVQDVIKEALQLLR